ncbi:uncharacterized protein LOC131158842 isoform X2 [Malania oleifera]|nr:uncharacterized protein LOC131158842 isoform X2 [Malania oleifera]
MHMARNLAVAEASVVQRRKTKIRNRAEEQSNELENSGMAVEFPVNSDLCDTGQEDSLSTLSLLGELHGWGNDDALCKVQYAEQEHGFSVAEKIEGSKLYQGKEYIAASPSDLTQKQEYSFNSCNDNQNTLPPPVADVSIGRLCAKLSEKIYGVVKRVCIRKVKPSRQGVRPESAKESEGFEKRLNQEVDGFSVSNKSKSDGKISSSNVDMTNHVCLAVDRKQDNLLRFSLSHSAVERAFIGSRRKLLVLDVNGLLADIVSPAPKDYKADIKIAKRAIFKRPYCSEFLNFCFEGFDVGIWSSRSKKILERVIDYLMGDMKDKLLFCWDLSHCTETGYKTLESKHKALIFKELKKIWEKHDPSLPWEKGDYNESNTLLLDDSPYKALLNPPHTALFPYAYRFQDGNDNSLG